MKVLQFTIPVSHDKSVILEQFDGPYHYPYLHRHKEIQITWIQRGGGTLISGNSMCHYKENEIYLLGANLPHLFKSDPEYFESNGAMYIKAFTIFFNPDGALSGLLDLPEMKAIKNFLSQCQLGIKIPDAFFDEVSQSMDAVRNSSGAVQIMHSSSMLNTFLQFSSSVESLSSYGGMPNITDNVGIRIGNVYNYIMQSYSETITLEDVAKAAYMTPESFCRYFKRHTGHTFVEFLSQIRINEACKKLVAHQFESISTVAYSCGFKSITNFNRVFKGFTGKSPREYVDNYFSGVSNATKIAS
jgi:AraC-like DNA-binding protein